MSEAKKRYPGESDEAHPEVFNTIPHQPKEKKPGQFTEEQLKQFFEVGVVQVDNFFTREELDPARDAVNKLVDDLAQKLHKAGKITQLYEDYDYHHRLTMLEKEFPGTNILLHKLGSLPQAFRDVWANPRLLNVVEQILGTPDMEGHPVWNLRCKTPDSDAATVPWHQVSLLDSAYMSNVTYDKMMAIAWIPLLDSNDRNGCMQMVHRGSKTGRMARHTCAWRDTWYLMLDEDEMEKTLEVDLKKDIVTHPVPYGGVLFFNNLIPHRSLNNSSPDEIRWSLDLRWIPSGAPAEVCGLKPGIKMRSFTDPNMKINWEPFDAVNRHKLRSLDEDEEEFNMLIYGETFERWEVVNQNQHTEAWEKYKAARAAAKADIEWGY